MKKLLLSLILLIFGVQSSFNESDVQAFGIEGNFALQKVMDDWCAIENVFAEIEVNKQEILQKNTLNLPLTPSKGGISLKAKVPVDKLIDDLPVKDFRYTTYRPAIAAENYDASIREIDLHRRTLAKNLRKANRTEDINQIFEDAEYLFTNALTQHLLPKWYGTLWDFYGHSEKPHEGFIACGYLVSTNLKHVGININRYTMAQQWPINMVQSLVGEEDIQHVFSRSRSIETIEQLGQGFYIVGLDKHVGFIRYDEMGMTFIHSNYISSNQAVVAEPIRSSVAYTQTQNYYLAKLSDNRDFLTKWLKGKRFNVKLKTAF